MKISLIIPTKDRPEELTHVLRSVFRQTRKPDELIIVDDGALDSAWLHALVQNHLPLRYIKKDRPGLTRSRNLGIEAAAGEILSFLDDDVELEPNYFAAVESIFSADHEKKIGGVGGYIVMDESGVLRKIKNAIERIFLLRGPAGSVLSTTANTFVVKKPAQEKEVQWLPGCNMNFRREVFMGDERFDERFTEYGLGEDLEFTYRTFLNGWKLIITPKTQLQHHHTPTARIAERRLGYMMIHNHRYIFQKLIPDSRINRLQFWWSCVGMMKLEVLNKISNPLKNRGGRFYGMWRAFWENSRHE